MASTTNHAVKKIAIRRIQATKTRSLFMGIVILFATAILSKVRSAHSSFGKYSCVSGSVSHGKQKLSYQYHRVMRSCLFSATTVW